MRWWAGPLLLFAVMLGACNQVETRTTAPTPTLVAGPTASETAPPTPVLKGYNTPPPEAAPILNLALTYQNPDGNRWIEGRGSLTGIEPLVAALDGTPAWVVGLPYEGGFLWVVTLESGVHQSYRLMDGELAPAGDELPASPPGAPIALVSDGNRTLILESPLADPAPLSHPVPLDGSGRIAALDQAGRVRVMGGESNVTSTDAGALPDARLLADGHGNLLVYGGATDRYAHGVLGDGLEAGELTLFDAADETMTWRQLPLPEGQVAEGISPIWVDFDNDGRREILVTLSDPVSGARLALLDEAGQLLAASPAIGQGFRWRHQIAAAPLGPDGDWEIVSNRTPHLGGIVEYFRLEGDELVRTARLPGYSSHRIGSRNLDMAAVGDFDGDGVLELLIPTQDRRALAAIQRDAQGASETWRLALDSPLATNLGAAVRPSGELSVAVGLENGTLLVWPAW